MSSIRLEYAKFLTLEDGVELEAHVGGENSPPTGTRGTEGLLGGLGRFALQLSAIM